MGRAVPHIMIIIMCKTTPGACAGDASSSDAAGRVPVGPREYTCPCKQCSGAPIGPFQPPQQPRWAADTDLLCCYYDSWRRMEQIKRARAHVVRAGFHERLERVCRASADKIDAAICSLGATTKELRQWDPRALDRLSCSVASEPIAFGHLPELVGGAGASR